MPGVLAVGGLVLYVLYTLATLAGFNATLTLPGLAGFVLSIGIAVDANVLIFERIREELDAGRPVRTAVDEGFRAGDRPAGGVDDHGHDVLRTVCGQCDENKEIDIGVDTNSWRGLVG